MKKIAEDKMVDLNAFKLSSAMKMIAGTARSMGINVKGNSLKIYKFIIMSVLSKRKNKQ